MRNLERKRKEVADSDLCPDMLQRSIRLKKRCNANTAQANAATGACDDNGNNKQGGAGSGSIPAQELTTNEGRPTHANHGGDQSTIAETTQTGTTRNKAIRRGPCFFGCPTTTNARNGVQIWKAPTTPTPWPKLPKSAALCNKCYCKGIALRRRTTEEASRSTNRLRVHEQNVLR